MPSSKAQRNASRPPGTRRAAYPMTAIPASTTPTCLWWSSAGKRAKISMRMDALRGGDALGVDSGRLSQLVATPEPLAEISCKDPQRLVRVAWHLGNRHLPTQIKANALRIRRDHVIEAMVRGLGARVIEIEAPFDPEGGAYADAFHAHAPESDSHSGHDHPSHEHSSDGGEHRHHDG